MQTSNINPTDPTPTGDRRILIVKDEVSCDMLAFMLKEGYTFDPTIKDQRLDAAWIVPLVKGEVLDPTPKLAEELLDGFMAVPPDDAPNGPVAQYLREGWVYVGYAAAKNLVQLKKPRSVAQ